MHEAHEAVPDRRPDQGTPGDDAAAAAADRFEADLETAVDLAFEVGTLVEVVGCPGDSAALRSAIPGWARRFNATYAGATWEDREYPETIRVFAAKRFGEWCAAWRREHG